MASADTERGFTFAFQSSEGEKHAAKGRPEQSLLSALRNSANVFGEEEKKNEGKTIQLLEREHLRGALNLGLPCRCLPENAHLEVLFAGSGGGSQGREDVAGDQECAMFTVASAPGILKDPESGMDLCVFALGGETAGEALSKDGRFLPEVGGAGWQLVERQSRQAFQLTVAAKQLQGGAYELGSGEAGACGQASLPGGRPNLCELARELDDYLKGRPGGGEPWEAAQKEFEELTGGNVPNRVPSNIAKLPMGMNESVGTLSWNRPGNEGKASCFHLAQGHVLTCYHAVKMMVGEGVPESEWGAVVREAATVSFTFRTTGETQWKLASLKAVSPELDYAVLALEIPEGRGAELRPGLATFATKPVAQGVVYTVGRQFTEALVLVPLSQEEDDDLSGRQSFQAFSGNTFAQQARPERVPYDKEFLHDPAASGSPVISYYGGLVGIHAGGYKYKERVVEFGPTIQAIAASINAADHPLYQQLFATKSQKGRCSIM
ncbi:serine protease FAM111B-like [Scyliorhinus canicula]|uniref:serine protease FAM111B-like n=1 Tax=Scyliorhinus canicula TaxID=7830 RepID=UPI0018F2CDA3|nr:serine protease FAM111B-like [Scyliorhinus canicula]